MTANIAIPANTIPFENFCSVLERLFKKKQRQEQDKILMNFFNDFRVNSASITEKKNTSLYPILRLLLPDQERERSAYNLKELKLGKLLVHTLPLSKQSQDAQKLLNFTSVQNSSQGSDFASVAYYVVKNRIGQNSGDLTIGDINEILDKIATAEVGNKRPILDTVFTYALSKLTAEQLKWFFRIILKDLKISMGTNRILAVFHPDAPELFENCGNLSKVCEELGDGDSRPQELGVQIFFAVSPMLSERLEITRVPSLPMNKTYQIENKFDGERFQMHMQNGIFEYFSRRGYAYSDNYGKNYDSGLLTPSLKNCFSANATSFILDGEMMGWHKQRQCFGSKGMSFDIKKITNNSVFRPCFCAFDVLYYNGKSLIGSPDKGGMPLSERIKILDTIFHEVTGVIHHSKRQIVKDSSHILEALNKAIDDQEEGIVVKDTESYYIANRRNAGWYKIKPEYTKSTMDDLDLVIIGADEAENKKQGRAKSFVIACADVTIPGEMPQRWVSVGRVASGLTFEERERICIGLEQNWTQWKRTQPPPNLVFNKEKPDFWIMPEHSIVLQVRATELIRSTDFGTAYTLRFPRVVRVRDDKPVKDVMTLDEFNNIVTDKGSVVKLASKRVNEDQLEAPEIGGTRKKRVAHVPQVAEQFRSKATGDVEIVSKALLGRKIHILSDDEDCKKPELIRILESHGGKHVANVVPDIWCCVAGRLTYYVRQQINSEKVDIVSTAWLRSLPKADELCSLSPLDMLAIKNETKFKLCEKYDSFGDSYTEFTDETTLLKCLDKMDKQEPKIYLTTSEMLSLDKELFGDNNPFSFLRPCYINFVNSNMLLELCARMYAANLCELQHPKLTHVIISVTDKIEDIENIKKCIKTTVHVVSEKWLEECFSLQKLLPEATFALSTM